MGGFHGAAARQPPWTGAPAAICAVSPAALWLSAGSVAPGSFDEQLVSELGSDSHWGPSRSGSLRQRPFMPQPSSSLAQLPTRRRAAGGHNGDFWSTALPPKAVRAAAHRLSGVSTPLIGPSLRLAAHAHPGDKRRCARHGRWPRKPSSDAGRRRQRGRRRRRHSHHPHRELEPVSMASARTPSTHRQDGPLHERVSRFTLGVDARVLGGNAVPFGWNSVTVPVPVSPRHARFGRLPFETLFGPAIVRPATALVSSRHNGRHRYIRINPDSPMRSCPARAPKPGELFTFLDHAATLEDRGDQR